MNEQHCSELISQISNSLQDVFVFPILGTSEYATLEHLLSLAQEYHAFSGGRVTSLELQSYLNVDMHYVDKVIQKVTTITSLEVSYSFILTYLLTSIISDRML